MAGKGAGGDDGLTILLVIGGAVGGALLLDYLLSGRRQYNAPLLPDRVEDRIDFVVKELDDQFGEQWVNLGLDWIASSLRRALPLPVVAAVYSAEAVSKNGPWLMGGLAKKQYALRQLGAR